MRIKFKQAVELKDKEGKRPKKFPVGTHEVEHHHLQTKWFGRCLKAGFVEDADPEAIVNPVTLIDRKKALAEKLANLPAPKIPGAPVNQNPPTDNSSAGDGEGEDGNEGNDSTDADESEDDAENEESEEEENSEEGSESDAEADSSKSKKRKKKRNR